MNSTVLILLGNKKASIDLNAGHKLCDEHLYNTVDGVEGGSVQRSNQIHMRSGAILPERHTHTHTHTHTHHQPHTHTHTHTRARTHATDPCSLPLSLLDYCKIIQGKNNSFELRSKCDCES